VRHNLAQRLRAGGPTRPPFPHAKIRPCRPKNPHAALGSVPANTADTAPPSIAPFARRPDTTTSATFPNAVVKTTRRNPYSKPRDEWDAPHIQRSPTLPTSSTVPTRSFRTQQADFFFRIAPAMRRLAQREISLCFITTSATFPNAVVKTTRRNPYSKPRDKWDVTHIQHTTHTVISNAASRLFLPHRSCDASACAERNLSLLYHDVCNFPKCSCKNYQEDPYSKPRDKWDVTHIQHTTHTVISNAASRLFLPHRSCDASACAERNLSLLYPGLCI
jgi:hypothetical protein